MGTSELDYMISKCALYGYRMQSNWQGQIQLVKPKRFSCLLFGFLMWIGIIPGLFYIFSTNDKSLLLRDAGNAIIVTNQRGSVKTVPYTQMESYSPKNPWTPVLWVLVVVIGVVINILTTVWFFETISKIVG